MANRTRTFVMFVTALVVVNVVAGGVVGVWSVGKMSASADPTLMFTPNPAYPGSVVEVTGTGFSPPFTACLILSISLSFEGVARCFVQYGTVTGVFQVGANTHPGTYSVTVNVGNATYKPQSVSAPIKIIQFPTQTMTTTLYTTVSTTVSTTIESFMQTSVTSATTTQMFPGSAWLQVIATASLTAAVTALIYHTYIARTARPTRKRMRQPSPAFDVDVKSGVDRERSPS